MQMKTKPLIIIILLSFACANFVNAQEKLSLQNAITIALKNNYDIQLSNNTVEIAKNNVSPGNAGMLPSLTGNFNGGGSRQNTRQTPTNGPNRVINDALSTNTNYGVSLDWKIFDGFQMFANYNRLKELQKQGEVQAKAAIVNTISEVINTYYTIVKQQQLLTAADSALDISRLRLKIADNKLKIGKGSKLDVLSATVDYNADTSAYLQQKDMIKTSMITLNRLLARDLNLHFKVDEMINIDNLLNYDTLVTQAAQQNPDLQNAFINKKIAELNLKQIKGQRYPSISLNSGYARSKSTTPTGFNQKFQANGFTYGVTASINIFNGFLQRKNERNASIEIKNADLTLNKTQQNVSAQLLSNYESYATYLEMVKLEQKNLEIAKQNLDITLEKYRLGSITPLELREAQKSALDAITRYVDVQYQTKLAEISLKEISGNVNLK